MWNRKELKSRGKIAFERNYGASVGVALLMGIITLLFGSGNSGLNLNVTNEYSEYRMTIHSGFAIIMGILGGMIFVLILLGIALRIFIENVFKVGGCRFFILNQTERPGIDVMLYGFSSEKYGNLVFSMFMRELFIILWTFLLIIPGIIKSYEYLMVPYILAENPCMNYREAMKISKEMMNGQKWQAFVMSLSFIGWNFLSVFTCGLLSVLYVNPYREAAFAEMYAFNKAKAYEQGYIR